MPITGTVTDGSGNAVDGAPVVAIDATNEQIIGTDTTASDGSYSISSGTDTTAHVLAQYDDGSGNQYHVLTQPFVNVTADTTYIDSFDNWDGSNYSGNTAEYSRDDSTALSGGSIYVSDQYYNEIVSTSGLSNYPSQGSEWVYYIRTGMDLSNNNPDNYHGWGVQSSSGDAMYRFRIQTGGVYCRIQKETSSGVTDLADGSASITIQSDTWHKVRIRWDDGNTFGGSAGDMECTVFNADESSSDTFNANDTEWSSGGVMFGADLPDGGGSMWHDEAEITN